MTDIMKIWNDRKGNIMNKDQTATFDKLVAAASETSKAHTKARSAAWDAKRAEEDTQLAQQRANNALQSFISSLIYDD